MAISLPLWLSGRSFPHLPWVPVFAPFPEPWDAVFLGLAATLLAASAFLPRGRPIAALSIAAVVLLGVQDQSRWQPWVYQYGLMLAAAAAAPDRDHPALLAFYRLFMVCGYFWSGIHKLGPGFQNLLESAVFVPLAASWPKGIVSLVRATGPLIPWIEIALALALCFRPTRRAGVVAAVTTHVLILLVLGPAGRHENPVVWPWNAVMIALVIILFWRNREPGWRRMFDRGFRWLVCAGVVLAGVMPMFSLAGKWDRYFSFQLYSGTDRRFLIIVDPKAAAALPAAFQRHLSPVDLRTRASGTSLP